MNITINPFQQLYFSDDTQSENNFVELFSDEVLQAAIHPVFQGGNVVLSGTQGCGKTMILNLLGPSGIIVGDGTIAGERTPQRCKTKSSTNIF